MTSRFSTRVVNLKFAPLFVGVIPDVRRARKSPDFRQASLTIRDPGIRLSDARNHGAMDPGSLTFLSKSKIWRKVASGMTFSN